MSEILREGQVIAGSVQNTVVNVSQLLQNQINALKAGNPEKVITNFWDFGVKQLDELTHPLIILSNILLIIGGLNSAAIALQNKNYINLYAGNVYARGIFIAMGAAAVYIIYVKYFNAKAREYGKKESFENISDEQLKLIKEKIYKLKQNTLTLVSSDNDKVILMKQIQDLEKQYGIRS
jgi:uncharacterized membrane protein YuzA (DUF378 family)